MGKKNLAIYTPGRRRWRKNFQAAEGRQIFGVDPREVAPWVTFFRLPRYVSIAFELHSKLAWMSYLLFVNGVNGSQIAT